MHSEAGRMNVERIKTLSAGRELHMHHYGATSLPFACVGASGLVQKFVELEGQDAGRTFDVLDASGGYGSACLGAGSAVVGQALQRAVTEVGYSTDEVVSGERAALLVRLFGDGGLWTHAFPTGQYHVSGRNSGSEGMELAIRLALESRFDRRRLRPASGREGRDRILAFEGAWHGWTSGLVPLLNRRHYRIGLPEFVETGPYGVQVDHIPFGDLDAARRYFAENGSRLLAVIVEPIQGDAGIQVPPDGYLRQLADTARESGALVVADEVLTFAKTGQFFAMADTAGPVPTDITVIGKSLGMGALSTAMVIARKGLTSRASGTISTSDLRPLTCAVIRDGLEHIVAGGLLEQSAVIGGVLRERLEAELVQAFPDVYREVRGRALMQGIELTESAAAHLPVLREHIIRSGVYVEFMAGAGRRSCGLRYVYPTMRIAPPLVTEHSHVEQIVGSLAEGTRRFRKAQQS
ncbi:aminotransferase class III-fold pyridoxal phosphate-dependent enzyme [Streptomyces xiangluensis]|uniref:Aminotransferase class III-fold pyridoxal phosphate-dependent enzyme n=1 Tax=Streptomyces xiangluensis TaxID=2665720 RepID=A0ABV8YJ13_9ACTN